MDAVTQATLRTIVDYWRRSQIASALESLTDERDERDEDTELQGAGIIRHAFTVADFTQGVAPLTFVNRCFARVDAARQKRLEKALKEQRPFDEPLQEFVDVVLSPFGLELPGERDLTHVLFGYARIDRRGILSVADVTTDLPPVWIGRRCLDPTRRTGNGFPLGSAEKYYRAVARALRTRERWPEDWTALAALADELWRETSGQAKSLPEYLANFFALQDGWIRMEASMPMNLAIAKQYERIDAELEQGRIAPLFANACLKTHRRPIEELKYAAHLGQMGSGFPLTRTQRDSLAAYLATPVSEVLAVNGPPGTGKTTLLQSVVASEMVTAALAGKTQPPLYLACAATNQAVSNIISAFRSATEKVEDPLADRWIPAIGRRLGVYFRAATGKAAFDQAKGSLVCLPSEFRGDVLRNDADYELLSNSVAAIERTGAEMPIQSILRLCEHQRSRDAFLAQAETHLGKSFPSIQAVADALHEQLVTNVAAITKYCDLADDLFFARNELGARHCQTIDEAAAVASNEVDAAEAHADVTRAQLNADRERARLEEQSTREAEDREIRRIEAQIADEVRKEADAREKRSRGLAEQERTLREIEEQLEAFCAPTTLWGYVAQYFPWVQERARRGLRRLMVLVEERGFGHCEAADIRGMREFAEAVTSELPRLRKEMRQLTVPDGARLRAVNERRERIHDEVGRRRSQRLARLDADERTRAEQQQAANAAEDLAIEREETFVAASRSLEAYAPSLGLRAVPSFDKVDGLIDTTLRSKAFLIAMHWWEAKFLLALDPKNANRINWRQQGQRVEAYRLDAMVAPCFVATFDKVPYAFNIKRGDIIEPMWQFADTLIVDEAGQASPDKGAYAFTYATKGLIVGDVDQLPPVDSSDADVVGTMIARETGAAAVPAFADRGMLVGQAAQQRFKGSLMRMASSASYFDDSDDLEGMVLREHFRCDDRIIAYCNEVWYTGNRALKPCGKERESIVPPFGFIEVLGKNANRRNAKEAQTILEFICEYGPALQKHYSTPGEPPKEIWQLLAVLTPFKNQAALLRDERTFLHSEQELLNPQKITMGTVHALQGAEREIILFSTVYDKWSGSFFFDLEHTLLNVAVSRAKDSFIVFGRRELFPLGANTDYGKPSTVLKDHLFRKGYADIVRVAPTLLQGRDSA